MKEPPKQTIICSLPEWVYPRASGDLTCFALTKEEALRTMREQGGYTDLDPTKLKETGRRLSDELQPIDGLRHGTVEEAVESERRALGLASTLPAPSETFIITPKK